MGGGQTGRRALNVPRVSLDLAALSTPELLGEAIEWGPFKVDHAAQPLRSSGGKVWEGWGAMLGTRALGWISQPPGMAPDRWLASLSNGRMTTLEAATLEEAGLAWCAAFLANEAGRVANALLGHVEVDEDPPWTL